MIAGKDESNPLAQSSQPKNNFKLKWIQRIVPALALFLLAGPLLSRPSYPGRFHRFERLTFQAEFPASISIFSVCQDEQGFLWLGTSVGLARYDGYRLVFFYPGIEQQPPPENVGVYPVTFSASGDIWFGTNRRGLFRFSRETEEFVNYRNAPGVPGSLSDDNIMAVQEDRQGNLWVGTRSGGLNRFDIASGAFSRFPLGPGTDVIWEVLADRSGRIWVGTLDAGLFRIDPGTGDTRNYRFRSDDPASLGSDTVWTVFEDEAGTIWAGTKNGGLVRYEPGKEGFSRIYGGGNTPRDLASQTITAIAQDRAGRIWLGTASDGLRIWDPETSDYIICRHDPQDAETLGDNGVTSLFRDASGIIWAGTVRGGLNKCPADMAKFAHFKHEASNPRSLGHSDVRALWADGDGTLWVGTKSGLEHLDLSTGHETSALPDPWLSTKDPSFSSVSAVVRDSQGTVWLGTEAAGLIKHDPRTGLFVQHRQDPEDTDSLSNNRVNALWLDRERPDVLWIGTQRGLNRFETRTNRWARFFNDPEDAASLSGNIVTAIHDGGLGFLWVGTTNGLNRLDKATGRCEKFISRFGDPPGANISSNTVNCIYGRSDGPIWIGTDNGLNRFDRAQGHWKSYIQKDGLTGPIVCGILEDDAGSLWLSTNRGLSKLDPRTERFTSFGLRDGLQGLSFNRGACVEAPDGRLFFGGTNGLNAYDPADIRKNPFVPPVVWTAFYRNNEEVKLPGTVFALRELSLTYKSGLVTLEFAALDFAAPELNSFAYRLDPRDSEWISLVPDHRISLYDLGPGRYTLRVKASNPDGVWNEDGIAVELTLLQPFWKTWWFRLIAAAFLLSGAALAIGAWRKIKNSPASLGRDLDGIIGSYDLTAREREILRLVLQGASNKDIERKLFISASTVRNHIYNIYQKLGVRNRLELINRVGQDARKAP